MLRETWVLARYFSLSLSLPLNCSSPRKAAARSLPPTSGISVEILYVPSPASSIRPWYASGSPLAAGSDFIYCSFTLALKVTLKSAPITAGNWSDVRAEINIFFTPSQLETSFSFRSMPTFTPVSYPSKLRSIFPSRPHPKPRSLGFRSASISAVPLLADTFVAITEPI